MKKKQLSLISFLLIVVLLITACCNDQTPATSSETSTPAASASPEAAEPTEVAGSTGPSVTPAVLTPPVDVTPTPDADGTPKVTPDASVPTGTGAAVPTEGGTLQPASPAVSEAGKATPAPSENKTPTKGGKPTAAPEPTKGSGKPTNTPKPTKAPAKDTPTPTMSLKEQAMHQGTGVVWTELCPEMLTLVNKARRELSLREKMWGDKELEEIALARVVDTIQELEDGCVHSGAKNYYHKGLECPILEIFAWGAWDCEMAFEVWRDSPNHWASIINDGTEDEVAACDIIDEDGREIKKGDIIPGVDAYMVCAHAIYEGDDYWVIVSVGKRRPWPND